MLQLIYSSMSCLPESGEALEQGVTEIISQSFPKNQRNNVTGILLHADGQFFQLLEGPAEGIEFTMGYIARDTRHRDVQIISQAPIDHYSLPYSPIACAGLGESLPVDVRDALADIQDSTNRDQTGAVIREYLLSKAKHDELHERLQALKASGLPLSQRGLSTSPKSTSGLFASF